MKDEQTRLAIEALKAAGCGVLAIHVESRIAELEKDAAHKGWNPEHVANAWYAMGLDVAGFSWGAFAYKVKDEQDTAMQKD